MARPHRSEKRRRRTARKPYDTAHGRCHAAADVHAFWFGAPPLATRDAWFRKDAAFDADDQRALRRGHRRRARRRVRRLAATPRGALARVLLLDQFTRNVFRDTPRAFAGDARALATAEDAIARGHDRALAPGRALVPVHAVRARRGSRGAGALARAVRRAGATRPGLAIRSTGRSATPP